jgi:hypothetical protein
MLPAKFGSIWPSSFRGEDCFNSCQSENRIALIKLNLAGSIYVRSSIKHLHLVPFGQQIWPPRAILFSDWLMLKKSSPLNSFRGEDCFNSRQSEKRIALGGHVYWPNGTK